LEEEEGRGGETKGGYGGGGAMRGGFRGDVDHVRITGCIQVRKGGVVRMVREEMKGGGGRVVMKR